MPTSNDLYPCEPMLTPLKRLSQLAVTLLIVTLVAVSVSTVLYVLGDAFLWLTRYTDVPSRFATVADLRVTELSPLALAFCAIWIACKVGAVAAVFAGVASLALCTQD